MATECNTNSTELGFEFVTKFKIIGTGQIGSRVINTLREQAHFKPKNPTSFGDVQIEFLVLDKSWSKETIDYVFSDVVLFFLIADNWQDINMFSAVKKDDCPWIILTTTELSKERNTLPPDCQSIISFNEQFTYPAEPDLLSQEIAFFYWALRAFFDPFREIGLIGIDLVDVHRMLGWDTQIFVDTMDHNTPIDHFCEDFITKLKQNVPNLITEPSLRIFIIYYSEDINNFEKQDVIFSKIEKLFSTDQIKICHKLNEQQKQIINIILTQNGNRSTN